MEWIEISDRAVGKEIAVPLKSQAQRAWMHATHPKMADEWEEHTPKGKHLPEKVCDKNSRRKKRRR